jgi:hypothetical protein
MNAQTSISGGQTGNKGKQNNQNENQTLTTEFDTDLDEFVTCSAAFKKLKDLVSRWLEDAI